jgi:hypothetical protein
LRTGKALLRTQSVQVIWLSTVAGARTAALPW